MFLSWLCINWTLRNWNLLNLAYPFWPNGINWTLRNWNTIEHPSMKHTNKVLIGPCGIETINITFFLIRKRSINWTLRNWNVSGWMLLRWTKTVLIGPCGIETRFQFLRMLYIVVLIGPCRIETMDGWFCKQSTICINWTLRNWNPEVLAKILNATPY